MAGFRRLAWFATVLAFCVVVLGAWVRLSDAGLGCPDWPGCYGQLTWPTDATEIHKANAEFPDRPYQGNKAWREMVHRYAAGTLGLCILGLAVLAWRRRRAPGQPWKVPLFLVALVVFQALLGMWTVTWQLKPLVVMGHLLGGLATLSLLFWTALRASIAPPGAGWRLRAFVIAALAVLVVQVALGGWTSANYAALACPDFPTCHGQWWPETDFAEGFVPWRGLGVNYEYGVLDAPARTAVHMAHRLGALTTVAVLGALAIYLLMQGGAWRHAGIVLLVLLATQVSLGVANVLLRLPLPVADAHNGGAAALLLLMVWLAHRAFPPPRDSLVQPA